MHKDLYRYRKLKKITQGELARVINRTATQYAKRERGEVCITLEEALLISKYLELPIYEVFPEYFFIPQVPKMHEETNYVI